ncbi:uncharacterized protein DUF4124 [Fluviicoccus keumensis]|uniref:Uncharacterized protein DUF4124 n=1 Tax=Fluviicoccus keumensis TaxID=1435465 RepID=A0A4Q7YNZ6_9GAMM|nr:DUF4124 domain-containing protein [Fluviicoccus keumensis]RZU38419.1 uncharacterized protein DUF4124 [Fluviicoccus keumensis]
MSRIIPACLTLLCLALPCHAEIFQWTDADGKVHFTDKPPANQKSRTVDIRTPGGTAPSPSAAPASTSGNDDALARQRRMLKTLDEEKAVKAEAERKATAQRNAQQQNCATLRDQQRQYNEGGRFYSLDDKGERKYHTDEEIAKQQEQVNRALAKCR